MLCVKSTQPPSSFRFTGKWRVCFCFDLCGNQPTWFWRMFSIRIPPYSYYCYTSYCSSLHCLSLPIYVESFLNRILMSQPVPVDNIYRNTALALKVTEWQINQFEKLNVVENALTNYISQHAQVVSSFTDKALSTWEMERSRHSIDREYRKTLRRTSSSPRGIGGNVVNRTPGAHS